MTPVPSFILTSGLLQPCPCSPVEILCLAASTANWMKDLLCFCPFIHIFNNVCTKAMFVYFVRMISSGRPQTQMTITAVMRVMTKMTTMKMTSNWKFLGLRLEMGFWGTPSCLPVRLQKLAFWVMAPLAQVPPAYLPIQALPVPVVLLVVRLLALVAACLPLAKIMMHRYVYILKGILINVCVHKSHTLITFENLSSFFILLGIILCVWTSFHSFILDISIAPLKVHYYSEALPTTVLILCRS